DARVGRSRDAGVLRARGGTDMHLRRQVERSPRRSDVVSWRLGLAIGAAASLGALGCQNMGQDNLRSTEQGPSTTTQISAATLDKAPGIQPGINPQVVLGDVHNPYAANAGAAAEGRQLFVQYNCS